MASTKPETRIVQACIKWIKQNGGDAFHVVGGIKQRGGEPDICGEIYSDKLGRWIHLKIEVKTPDGKLSKRQDIRVQHYITCEYCAGVVTSVEDMKTLIRTYEDLEDILKWL